MEIWYDFLNYVFTLTFCCLLFVGKRDSECWTGDMISCLRSSYPGVELVDLFYLFVFLCDIFKFLTLIWIREWFICWVIARVNVWWLCVLVFSLEGWMVFNAFNQELLIIAFHDLSNNLLAAFGRPRGCRKYAAVKPDSIYLYLSEFWF